MKRLNDILFSPLYTQSQTEVRLRMLLEAFCDQAALEGYKIQPYSQRGWNKFLSLSDEKKESILTNFLSYYELACVNMDQGHKISNSSKLLWNFLKKMNLRPTSDFFNCLKEDDIIEIYGTDFVQTFRNLNFFEACTYTIIDIFTYDWIELFTRENQIIAELSGLASEVLGGKHSQTVKINVDRHTLIESLSENPCKIDVYHKYIAPLYSEGSIHNFIIVSDAKIIETSITSNNTENIIPINFRKTSSPAEI